MAGKVVGILLAAGSSTRMGENKLLMKLAGETPLELSYAAFVHSNADSIIIVVSKDTEPCAKALAAKQEKPTFVIKGGKTRSHSVNNALLACNDCEIVVIHDAARCLVTPEIINISVKDTQKYGSAIAKCEIRDTLRNKASHGTINRDECYAMQTPQTFVYAKILDAYSRLADDFTNTDDCALFVKAGNEPHYFEAGFANQKLTYPQDIEFFTAVLEQRKGGAMDNIRIGLGEDTHRLAANRRLILGGVSISYCMGLLGHSDADVLCHAVSDALLGACALHDIGTHFPDSDNTYKDANSLELLSCVSNLVKNAGFAISNIDATITAQEPKLAPYIDEMRANIANAIEVDITNVSVKATTPEHTGAEGNLECITVRACALVRQMSRRTR